MDCVQPAGAAAENGEDLSCAATGGKLLVQGKSVEVGLGWRISGALFTLSSGQHKSR